MSGPGKPNILGDTVAYHEIRLRSLFYEIDPDDPEDDDYVITIWGRPDADGWFGWYKKEFVKSQPPTLWLRGVYEQIKD